MFRRQIFLLKRSCRTKRISNLCKYKVRKRKSTIRKDDNSSQKNAKMGIEGGGLLDNLDTGKAGSKCPHPFFNTEKVRMEKAEKSIREQRWVERSRCGSRGLPIAWEGICEACEREGEREVWCDEPDTLFDYKFFLRREDKRLRRQRLYKFACCW